MSRSWHIAYIWGLIEYIIEKNVHASIYKYNPSIGKTSWIYCTVYTVRLYSRDGSNTTNSDNYERRDITLALWSVYNILGLTVHLRTILRYMDTLDRTFKNTQRYITLALWSVYNILGPTVHLRTILRHVDSDTLNRTLKNTKEKLSIGVKLLTERKKRDNK